jgi:limonene-1,2-epoxide hydrolase
LFELKSWEIKETLPVSIEAIAAADALGAAIKARSTAQIDAVFSDDIVVWHGSTGVGMSKSQNIELLGGVFQLTSTLEYRDIRRHLISGGVVQQHRLCGTFSDGRALPDLHACLVMQVRDGKISRIDEYFDGQTFAEVWTRLDALKGPTTGGH